MGIVAGVRSSLVVWRLLAELGYDCTPWGKLFARRIADDDAVILTEQLFWLHGRSSLRSSRPDLGNVVYK